MSEELTYGSHMPALRSLARFTKIRSVVEFGVGKHSTPLFLDRENFPDLASLVSIENNSQWANNFRTEDDRHTLIVKPTDELLAVRQIGDEKADLVFLDCAPMGVRMSILSHALEIANIVAIHDVSLHDLAGFNFKYTKSFEMPVLTVVASDSVDVSSLELD